jgi:hypothetical protein
MLSAATLPPAITLVEVSRSCVLYQARRRGIGVYIAGQGAPLDNHFDPGGLEDRVDADFGLLGANIGFSQYVG